MKLYLNYKFILLLIFFNLNLLKFIHASTGSLEENKNIWTNIWEMLSRFFPHQQSEANEKKQSEIVNIENFINDAKHLIETGPCT